MTYVEIEVRESVGGYGYAVHHWDVERDGAGEIADMRYLGEFEVGGGHDSAESAREAASRRLTAEHGGGWGCI